MNVTPEQVDALKELINIGVGRASGVLSEMVSSHIILQVPFIKILSPADTKKEMENISKSRLATVRLGFRGPFSGTAALVFPPDSASKLVNVLTGEEPGSPDLDSVRVGTLSEVGNIVINGVMGSIANVLNHQINYSLPDYLEENIENLIIPHNSYPDVTVLLAHTHFIIKKLHIEGDIILIFEVGSLDAIIAAINPELEKNV